MHAVGLVATDHTNVVLLRSVAADETALRRCAGIGLGLIIVEDNRYRTEVVLE
jgi:hypothetical protein